MDNETPVDPVVPTEPASDSAVSPPVVDEAVHTIEHRSFGRPADEPMVVTVITGA